MSQLFESDSWVSSSQLELKSIQFKLLKLIINLINRPRPVQLPDERRGLEGVRQQLLLVHAQPRAQEQGRDGGHGAAETGQAAAGLQRGQGSLGVRGVVLRRLECWLLLLNRHIFILVLY